MKQPHIALSINHSEDIDKLYKDIFGMEEVKSFVLDRSLSKSIFTIDQDVSVQLLKRGEVLFELFITDKIQPMTFNHVCLAFSDRKEVCKAAQLSGYTVIEKQKGQSTLLFIKDKSNNIFELKDIGS